MAPSNLPRLDEVTLNSRVLIFTLLLSLGSGLFFGLFPVLRHRKGKLVDALKEGGRGGMKDRGRSPEDILSVRLYIPGREVSSAAEVATTYEAIVHRLEQIPGVTSVGLATDIPMDVGGPLRREPSRSHDLWFGGRRAPPGGTSGQLSAGTASRWSGSDGGIAGGIGGGSGPFAGRLLIPA